MVIMKDMSVYKAEVFRRSGERIRARKAARNRALAFCIPLLFVAAVWSVAILPAMMPAKSEDRAQNFAPEMENVGSGLVHPYVELEITTSAEDCKVSEAPKITELYSAVTALFYAEESADGCTEENSKESAGSTSDMNYGEKYTLTFVTANGEEQSYVLYRNTLTDEKTSETVILGESERQELIYAISLAEKGE